MKDIPVFTTQYGVASLTLRQIPCRKEAYIHLQDCTSEDRSRLIKECTDFCRAAGAETIYVTPAEKDADVSILEMRGVPALNEEDVKNIFPVTEQTVGSWRKIANEKLKDVDLAAMLQKQDEENILSSGGAYFVHSEGKLLGIGWIQDDVLKLIAAAEPGQGYYVAQTLLSVQPGQSIRLEVASTNHRAIALYEKLGFLPVRELESWQRVL